MLDQAARDKAKAARAATVRPAPSPQTQILDLLKWQRGRCAACRATLGNKYHADHVIALATGGSNDITNIQLLCGTCNCRKGMKHPVEFMQQQGYLL